MSKRLGVRGWALVLAGCLALSAPVAGQSAIENVAAPAAASPAAESAQSDFVIGNGDQLQVRVFGIPDLDRKVRVNGDGEITLPLVGRVMVGGLTAADAAKVVRKTLIDSGYLVDPHVSVLISESSGNAITVTGEVTKPGVYALAGQPRLMDAISAAGGTTPRSGREVTIARRADSAQKLTVTLGPDPAQSAASNVLLMPGDTVLVSKAGIVFVVGDVQKPGGFLMENNTSMTVLQAVALANGIKSTASLKNAKVIRKTGQGPQEIDIKLNEIMQARAPDQMLLPDDIVFVPSSKGKAAAQRGLETLLRMATGAVIYRPL